MRQWARLSSKLPRDRTNGIREGPNCVTGRYAVKRSVGGWTDCGGCPTFAAVSKAVKLPPVIEDRRPPRIEDPVGVAQRRRARSLRMHPYSGGLMLLIDFICWGANALTVGLATPWVMAAAFVLTSFGVFLSQIFLDRDGLGASIAKAFFAGVVTAVPTPILGTIVGAAIIKYSGLDSLEVEARSAKGKRLPE